MNELLDIIIKATADVFGITEGELLCDTRNREYIIARRAAAWIMKKEGIPARMLAERCGMSRWTINRMQTEARQSTEAFFLIRVKEIEAIISTQKARRKQG